MRFAKVTNFARFLGLDSAKENGSAVTIPKEFERFDETEDFGV
jgi:hypothetical protein